MTQRTFGHPGFTLPFDMQMFSRCDLLHMLHGWVVFLGCRLQCKPLEHVSCALPWSSSLLLAMQHGVHQSGLANQGSAVH